MIDERVGFRAKYLFYLTLLAFSLTLFIDLGLLKAHHFFTMEFQETRLLIIAITILVSFGIIASERKEFPLQTSLIVGMLLGWSLSSLAKSYIQFQNEQDTTLTVVTEPMLLAKKYSKEQLWVMQNKDSLLEKSSIFISYRKGQYINDSLRENIVYAVPIKVGKYHDVFIPHGGFKELKELGRVVLNSEKHPTSAPVQE